jgi:predicted RNase H-like nuclease (RuvC/YqgF family)
LLLKDYSFLYIDFRQQQSLEQLLKDTVTKSALRQEKEALRRENEALQRENEALQRENEALQRENEALQRENMAIRSEKEALQRKYEGLSGDYSKAEETIGRLSGEITALKLQLSEAVFARETKEREIAVLKTDLATALEAARTQGVQNRHEYELRTRRGDGLLAKVRALYNHARTAALADAWLRLSQEGDISEQIDLGLVIALRQLFELTDEELSTARAENQRLTAELGDARAENQRLNDTITSLESAHELRQQRRSVRESFDELEMG